MKRADCIEALYPEMGGSLGGHHYGGLRSRAL